MLTIGDFNSFGVFWDTVYKLYKNSLILNLVSRISPLRFNREQKPYRDSRPQGSVEEKPWKRGFPWLLNWLPHFQCACVQRRVTFIKAAGLNSWVSCGVIYFSGGQLCTITYHLLQYNINISTVEVDPHSGSLQNMAL